MRQQVLEFVLEASTAPRIALERRVVDDLVKRMADLIVAVHEKGAEESDEEPSNERQDQE
jgi:hypothetical protein